MRQPLFVCLKRKSCMQHPLPLAAIHPKRLPAEHPHPAPTRRLAPLSSSPSHTARSRSPTTRADCACSDSTAGREDRRWPMHCGNVPQRQGGPAAVARHNDS